MRLIVFLDIFLQKLFFPQFNNLLFALLMLLFLLESEDTEVFGLNQLHHLLLTKAQEVGVSP